MVSGRSSSAGSSSSSSCSFGGKGRGGGPTVVAAASASVIPLTAVTNLSNGGIVGGGNAEELAGLQLDLGGGEMLLNCPHPQPPSQEQELVQISTEMSQIGGLGILGKEGVGVGVTNNNGIVGEGTIGENLVRGEEVTMNNNNNILVTLQEKRIIAEFCHLLEKSKQLFNQLRELPPDGSSFSTSSTTATTPSVSGGSGGGNGGGIQIQTLMGTSNCSSSTSAAATATAAATSASATFTCQQAYFSRAFDIYTRLWKYQQTHRNTLDKKYGLKRWQIGDIASKIGQLYYHYYQRTSDISYLAEAANFYGAIRGRGYYARTPQNSRRDSGTNGGGKVGGGKDKITNNALDNSVGNGNDSGLIVKKLRYYARFVIVSMLLRKNNVKELLRELSGHVENYVATVDEEPEEQLEWNLVLSEIRSFIDADSPVEVYEGMFTNGEQSLLEQLELGILSQPLIMSHRLPKKVPKYSGTIMGDNNKGSDIISGGKSPYVIQEVLIIGNKQDQLKFSELTVDMFRMMQSFERAPKDEREMLDKQDSHVGEQDKMGNSEEEEDSLKNPHKYLLYRASIEQILANLNSAWSELTWNGVLLVYISSDPSSNNGIATVNSNSRGGGGGSSSSNHQRGKLFLEESKEIHCLYPYDLLPLTRKPLVAIIDSDNSHVFLQLGQQKENFGQPLVILVSPEVIINSPTEAAFGGSGGAHHHSQHHHHHHHHHHHLSSSNRGSIFTLFLHSPLAALCTLCGVKVVSSNTWSGMERLINVFYREALDHIREEAPQQHNSDWDVYLKLIGDDFFRMVFLRYLFCHTVYSMHKESQVSASRPKSFPEVSLLNQDKIETSRFEELIFEIADSIQSKNLFKRV